MGEHSTPFDGLDMYDLYGSFMFFSRSYTVHCGQMIHPTVKVNACIGSDPQKNTFYNFQSHITTLSAQKPWRKMIVQKTRIKTNKY